MMYNNYNIEGLIYLNIMSCLVIKYHSLGQIYSLCLENGPKSHVVLLENVENREWDQVENMTYTSVT